MIKALLNEIESQGDRGAVVPASRFDDLRREMEKLGSNENHFFSEWMAGAMSLHGDLSFEPRSLISVITPVPKVILTFEHLNRPVQCVVPPTYTDESIIEQKVLQYINAFIMPFGCSAATAGMLPQKLLAVHCGLAFYGRNNISYNKKFGSYMRVLSYVSDLPCDEADWYPLRRMEMCDKCNACVAACPNNAIDINSRIVNATKCLTFMNEFPGEFPDWVDTNAHNCIIGCVKCQDCCPANAHNKNNVAQGVSFTEEETNEVLSHKDDEPYSDSLTAKLEATGLLPESIQMMPRNLAVLLNAINV